MFRPTTCKHWRRRFWGIGSCCGLEFEMEGLTVKEVIAQGLGRVSVPR